MNLIAEYGQAFLFVGGTMSVLILMAWVTDRLEDRSIKQRRRMDQHISRSEQDLLGDDYRDRVATYFNRRRDCDERVARAVDHACYRDGGKS